MNCARRTLRLQGRRLLPAPGAVAPPATRPGRPGGASSPPDPRSASPTKPDEPAPVLRVPGASLYYEVSGSGPVLLLIPGGPADADVFAGLAPLLIDRYTIVRYDPRGVSRSRPDGPPRDVPIEVQADDAHRMLLATGTAPAAVFGSSGGGQIGLALVARHPGRVRVLVAHEPPAAALLPQGDRRRALAQEVYAAYQQDGIGPAMRVFHAGSGLGGDAPGASGPRGGPSPERREAMARMRQNLGFFLAHSVLPIATYVPDTAALRAAGSRVVVGVGEASGGQLAHDAGLAVAARLGTAAVSFPGGHAGYLDHPAAFARTLHEVLQAE